MAGTVRQQLAHAASCWKWSRPSSRKRLDLLAHRVETGSASEGEAGGTERFARQCPQQAAHPLFQVPIADVARVMGHLGSRKYRRPSQETIREIPKSIAGRRLISDHNFRFFFASSRFAHSRCRLARPRRMRRECKTYPGILALAASSIPVDAHLNHPQSAGEGRRDRFRFCHRPDAASVAPTRWAARDRRGRGSPSRTSTTTPQRTSRSTAQQ